MKTILEVIKDGRWFKEPSPFRLDVQFGHDKLCVITGPNTSGKSLLRKIIHARYSDRKMTYVNLSQEGRCEGGIKRAFLYGSEQDDSTGYNSVKSLLTAIRSGQGYTTPFAIMLDEPEIGCSEELQAALGERIVRDIDTMPHLNCLYVITHSREVSRRLLSLNPTHVRLGGDGMTLDQFVHRPVTPATLEEVMESGPVGWRAVEGMLKAAKAS